MAKDPAFLFYPGDWQGGTMYFDAQTKGCYIDLMILQFNVGKFTEEQAKQVLSICFDVAWPKLMQKFVSDGNFYWNERLSLEIEKRRKFTESRRNNGSKQKNTRKVDAEDGKHMHKHMENENYIDNKGFKKEKKSLKNKSQEMISLEKKHFKFKIQGVGEVEVNMLMSGADWWLSEIEKFITQSEDRFIHIAMQKPFMQKPSNFSKILQTFIDHHQASADEQAANRIRNHFKNWISKQNESLESLVKEKYIAVESEFYKKLDSKEKVEQFINEKKGVGITAEERKRLMAQIRASKGK